jgi:hypothetical protein
MGLSQTIISNERIEQTKERMSKLEEKILNLEEVNQQLKTDIEKSLRATI